MPLRQSVVETAAACGSRPARIAGLDFVVAGEALESRYRKDVPVLRDGEPRARSTSCALGLLAVRTVAPPERDGAARVISLSPGKQHRTGGPRRLARRRIQ